MDRQQTTNMKTNATKTKKTKKKPRKKNRVCIYIQRRQREQKTSGMKSRKTKKDEAKKKLYFFTRSSSLYSHFDVTKCKRQI